MIKEDPRAARVAKPDRKSPRRVNDVVAAVMVFDRAATLAEHTALQVFILEE